MKSIFGGHVLSELSVADITFLDQKIVLQIPPEFWDFHFYYEEILTHGESWKNKISLILKSS